MPVEIEVPEKPLFQVPTATPAGPDTPHAPRLRRWRPYLLVAGALALAAAGVSRAWPYLFPPASPSVVTASGRIEGRDVTLAPKDIQGRVKTLLADEGQTVKRGQILAELDAAQVEARAAAVRANLAALDGQIAQAALDVRYTLKSNDASIAGAAAAVSTAEARVDRAGAVLSNATADYRRATSLLRDGAIAQQTLDQSEMVWRTSQADLDAARRDLAHAQASLAQARAVADAIGLKRQQVRTLEQTRGAVVAQLAEAEANLAERQIVAPIDGVILSRTVEVGDVVSPGSPVFQMVDMSRLYLKVYIPEPDIAKLRLGDPADVSVDAFPNRTFAARISRISEQAEFTPKNVETAEERLKLVFGVELAFVTPDSLLKPGMPADCVIHWQPGVASAATRHGL